MKLSTRYQYIVLCENKQTQAFIKHFLRHQRIESGKIILLPVPGVKGNGEAYVRKRFVIEYKELKRRHYSNILIVCTDADNYSVEERLRKLLDEVEAKDIEKNDPIMFWIPKHQIETWIYYLGGKENVDEASKYRHDKPIRCKNESEKLSIVFQNDEKTMLLPSLISAQKEYTRICELQVKDTI